MPLEPTLQDELRQEIERETAVIGQRAREQGEALLAEAETWAQERSSEATQRLDEEVILRSRRTLAKADLEARNTLLRLRRCELDQVFRQTSEQLSSLRDGGGQDYRELMTRVYEKCRRLLPEGSLRVRLGPGLGGLRQELEQQEGITVETDDRLFGLAVETADGRLRCDGSVPRLLTQIRREREAQLEAVLFGEER